MSKKIFVVGLTGCPGAGKSTVARMFRGKKIARVSADKIVRELYKSTGSAYELVARLFPAAQKKSAIDRRILSRLLFEDPGTKERFDRAFYPLLIQELNREKKKQQDHGKRVIVAEIPLLFECNLQQFCDVVYCVTAPAQMRRARVLERKGMTPALYAKMIKAQWSQKKKAQAADIVIPNGGDIKKTREKIYRLSVRLQGLENERNRS